MNKYLKINKLIKTYILNYKIYFVMGVLLVLFGIIFVLFLRINYLVPMINEIRGHTVTQVGLDRINQIYLLPLKIFFIGFGLLFVLIASWIKFPKWLDFIYRFIKHLASKISKLKTYQFLFFLFIGNLILRIFLLLQIPEFLLSHDGADYIDVARSLFMGQGLTYHTISLLSVLPKAIPASLGLYPPLFPVLIFLSYKIFGVSFFSAGLVNVFFASLLPVLLYLIVWQVTKSKKTALLAAILLSVNGILVDWSTRILTEIPFAFFVLLSFVFLTRKNKWWNLSLAGLFFGLTFLVRYQALVLLGPIICLYLYLKSGFKKSVPQILLVGLVALAVVSPWLIRNYQVFGTPFYTELSTAGGYQDFNVWSRTIGATKSFLTIAKEDFLGVAKAVVHKFVLFSMRTPTKIMGSFFIFIFAVYGLYKTFKTQKRKYLIFYIHIGLYYLFFSFIAPLTRFLYPVIPFFIFFAAIGFWELFEFFNQKRKFRFNASAISKITIILFILSSIIGLFMGVRSATGFMQEKDAVLLAPIETSHYFKSHSIENKTIIVDARTPRFFHYIMPELNVVMFPLNKKDFLYLIERYNIDYIVLPHSLSIGKKGLGLKDRAIVEEIVDSYQDKELVHQQEDSILRLRIYEILKNQK